MLVESRLIRHSYCTVPNKAFLAQGSASFEGWKTHNQKYTHVYILNKEKDLYCTVHILNKVTILQLSLVHIVFVGCLDCQQAMLLLQMYPCFGVLAPDQWQL